MTMLVLLRHGQTSLNAEGRLAGRLDVPLTELGETQARAAAAAVRRLGEPIRIVSSPLRRARQTAEMIGGPVEIDERWIELDYGEYDGVKSSDVPEAVWSAWRADPDYAPPGGESLNSVGERVRAACDEIARSAPVVVVVSHVSPIKAAVTWALGVPDALAWRFYLAPASITTISVGERGPSLHSYNVTTHLEAL